MKKISYLLRVSVLIDKRLHAVGDGSGVVLYAELLLPLATRALHETLVLAELALDIGQVGAVATLKTMFY